MVTDLILSENIQAKMLYYHLKYLNMFQLILYTHTILMYKYVISNEKRANLRRLQYLYIYLTIDNMPIKKYLCILLQYKLRVYETSSSCLLAVEWYTKHILTRFFYVV